MRAPRISLALLLGVVALAGLDFALMRRVHSGAHWVTEGDVLLGLLLPGNAVVVAAIRIGQQVRQRGACSPFLLGFAAFGGCAMMLFPLSCLFFPTQVDLYVDFFVNHCFNVLEAFRLAHSADQFNDALWLYVIEPTVASIVYGTPQMALALLGGWLVRRRGIVVARQDRVSPAELA